MDKRRHNLLLAGLSANRRVCIWFVAMCLSVVPFLAERTNMPDTMTNSFAADPAAVIAGKVSYDQTCQSCHGGGRRVAIAVLHWHPTTSAR
jgi:cytochrome c5